MHKRYVRRLAWSYIVILSLSMFLTSCSLEQSTELISQKESTAVPQEEEDNHIIPISVGCSTKINLPEYLDCSDGSKLAILPYPDSILGSDQDMLLGCQTNTLSVFIGSVTVATDIVPELALFSIPFLCSDLEDYREHLQSDWMDWFQPYFQKENLQLLAWDATYDGCMLSQIPLKCIDDFRQLNIRTMKNPYRNMFWSSTGANVLSLSYDEISYYLQTNQVNALEGGLRALVRSHLIEPFQYLMMLHHIPGNNALVMNKDAYDALTGQEQNALIQYANEAVSEHEDIIECIAEEYHLTCMEASPDLVQELYTKRDDVIEQLKVNLGEDTVNSFLQTLEE